MYTITITIAQGIANTWNCLKHSLGKDPKICGPVFEMKGTIKLSQKYKVCFR